jgi:Cyclic nucleotide-binding domain
VGAPRTPLRALAANGSLRREAAALALYRLAEFGPWVGMLVYAYSRGGATATGVVSLALLVPTALFAPLAGPLIDRFGASRVLVSAYAGQSVVMGATAASLLAGAPPLVNYTLGALTAMSLVITHPAHAVVSPGIVHTAEELVALNALTGWILSLGLVLAPAGAGLILAVSTPGAVYAAGSACLVIATLLVVKLGELVPPLASDADTPTASAIRQLHQGALALAHSTAPREVVIVLGATFLMVGALDVLVVVLAVGTLDMGESGAGYLAAAHGAGAVLGALTSLTLVGRTRLVPVMLGASLVAAGAFITLGLEISVVAAFVVAAVTGVSRSLLEVSGQTLLQRVTSTQLLARVFAFKEGLAMAAWGVGSVLVPIVIAVVDIRGALLVTGAIVPVVVVLRLRPLLAADASATIPTVRIALLRSLAIFRSLPVPALEGVAQNASDVSVPAGQTIVRFGEAGDCYYAIADGTVEVSRNGVLLNTLGRGDGFGEIALVDDVPRTATVTTRTDTRLLVIDRERFLVALTGHAPTRERVERIATERRPSPN